jgi:hypothetical protein
MSLALAIPNENLGKDVSLTKTQFRKVKDMAIMTHKVSKMSVKSGTVGGQYDQDKNGFTTLTMPWGTPPDILKSCLADVEIKNKKNATLLRMRRKLAEKKN